MFIFTNLGKTEKMIVIFLFFSFLFFCWSFFKGMVGLLEPCHSQLCAGETQTSYWCLCLLVCTGRRAGRWEYLAGGFLSLLQDTIPLPLCRITEHPMFPQLTLNDSTWVLVHSREMEGPSFFFFFLIENKP